MKNKIIESPQPVAETPAAYPIPTANGPVGAIIGNRVEGGNLLVMVEVDGTIIAEAETLEDAVAVATARLSRPAKPYALASYESAQVQAACRAVALDLETLAHAIRREDAYAAHVTESKKDDILADRLASAAKVRTGEIPYMGVLQRIIEKLSGDCVAMLP